MNGKWSLYHKGIQYNVHFDFNIKEFTGIFLGFYVPYKSLTGVSWETGVEDSLSGDKFIAINENWNYYFQWNNNARNVFNVLSFPQCRQCTMHHFS